MRGFQNLKFCSLTLVALLLGIFSNARLAESAVIKITQSKAQNGAVTPGDAPGFPVTISRSGSYVLDGNLTVPADTDGIVITASQVTIRLMGFTIKGSGGIVGSGILAAFGVDNIHVYDGFITGMGDHGISIIGSNMRIERVTVHGNQNSGLDLGDRATVVRSNSSNNTVGLGVRKNSLIADNIISQNQLDGIQTFGGTIARNTISENGSRGVVIMSNNALLISNTIERNGGLGIQFGLQDYGGGYRDNVINYNLGGTVFGGKNMGGNLCNQSLTCP